MDTEAKSADQDNTQNIENDLFDKLMNDKEDCNNEEEENDHFMDEVDESYSLAIRNAPPTHIVYLRSDDFNTFQNGIMEIFDMLDSTDYEKEINDGEKSNTATIILLDTFGPASNHEFKKKKVRRAPLTISVSENVAATTTTSTIPPEEDATLHLKIVLCTDHAKYTRLPNPEHIRTLCRTLFVKQVLASVEIHCPELKQVEKYCHVFHEDFAQETLKQYAGCTLAQMNSHLSMVASVYLPTFIHPCFFVKTISEQGKIVAHVTFNLCHLAACFFEENHEVDQFMLCNTDSFFQWQTFVDSQTLPENVLIYPQ